MTSTISRERLDGGRRVSHTAKLFGINFPLRLEPCIFNMTGMLSDDYRGGLWNFYTLGNGAFYMSPDSTATFNVVSENGFAGGMSADALGLCSCLYAYSHLSFGGDALAAQRRQSARNTLAIRALVPAQRTLLPGPWRLALGLSDAARFTTLGIRH